MNFLPSESEILSRTKGNWDNPVVTFLCITYNQEDYIEQTINGFLEQKTSFPYEILIHDDCSTDGTVNIIETYRLKYPRIIKCIYQAKNQYSQGISPVVIAGKECRSDYVALCEGDDYWINENKIENQYNLMCSDNSISMIISPGKLERNGEILSELHGYHGSKIKEVGAQEILNDADQFAPTASYFLKKVYMIDACELFIEAPFADLFIELYSAVFGKVVYYPEVGSVYRVAAKNSWSEYIDSNRLNNYLKLIKSIEKIIEFSKSVEGFEHLDWSVKLACMYSDIAMIHLKNKEFEKFREMISISNRHSSLRFSHKIIFSLRNYPMIFPFTVYPAIFLKSKIRIFLNKYKAKAVLKKIS